MSKAFDKVWHEGLLLKLVLNAISGNLLTNVETRISQGSILGSLFFLIYINDLSDGLTSNPKLFADTSLFSVVQNINSTANNLNSDLMKISNWAFQWKMRFSLDPYEQAQGVILSRKINKIDHPPIYFNQNLVKSSSTNISKWY